MTRGIRAALVAGTALLSTAWCAAQLLLTHRMTAAAHRHDVAAYHRFVDLYGAAHVVRPQPVPMRAWLVPATSSIVAALALSIVAALLVRGGRSWWATVVVAVPAANIWHGWEDGHPLGNGWLQLTDRLTGWQVAGTLVDSALLAAVVVTLVLTVRPRPHEASARTTVLRVVPPMLVLAGWWFDRNPLPDQVHVIWLLQALAYVLAVGLLATSRLPVAVRAAGVLVVLPFCSVATASAAIDGYGFVAPFVHHDLFAVVTATYVLGVPALVRALHSHRTVAVAASGG